MMFGVEITRVISKQVENRIEIEYVIDGAEKGQLFDVEVYCSINGETQSNPLTKVSGDIGTDVLGNGVKQVKWDVLKEYGALHGDVKFKIVATPTKVLKYRSSKLNGAKVDVVKASQRGNIVQVTVDIKNDGPGMQFDLYTNYIKAIANDGTELYASSYTKGGDKVTTKRPIMISSGNKTQIVIEFEVTDKVQYIKLLEIESRFPNDIAILSNVIVSE